MKTVIKENNRKNTTLAELKMGDCFEYKNQRSGVYKDMNQEKEQFSNAYTAITLFFAVLFFAFFLSVQMGWWL